MHLLAQSQLGWPVNRQVPVFLVSKTALVLHRSILIIDSRWRFVLLKYGQISALIGIVAILTATPTGRTESPGRIVRVIAL